MSREQLDIIKDRVDRGADPAALAGWLARISDRLDDAALFKIAAEDFKHGHTDKWYTAANQAVERAIVNVGQAAPAPPTRSRAELRCDGASSTVWHGWPDRNADRPANTDAPVLGTALACPVAQHHRAQSATTSNKLTTRRKAPPEHIGIAGQTSDYPLLTPPARSMPP